MTSSKLINYGTTGSFHSGELPERCKRCLRGEKLVVYATGVCGVGCFYCTLSKSAMRRDSIAVNEVKVADPSELFAVIQQEYDLNLAIGAGITGGDPLVTPKRTVDTVKKLKTTYGENHHIHLYTSGRYLTGSLLWLQGNSSYEKKDHSIRSPRCSINHQTPRTFWN